MFYLFRERDFLKTFLFIPFLLILFLDSFTIFTGLHFSRHIAYFYPILILFFYRGLRYIKFFLPYIYLFYFLVLWIPFVGSLKDQIETAKIWRINALKVGSMIPDKSEVLIYTDSFFFFYNMDRLKIRSIAPDFNSLFAKKIKNFVDRKMVKNIYVELLNTHYRNANYFYGENIGFVFKEIIPDIFPDTIWKENYKGIDYLLLKRKIRD
ncbi:MAG: hypothetical protein ABIN73_03130 [candidate division WOR-3 bacterium]